MIFSPQFLFVRCRQLEGTYPGDRWSGCWPVTAMRVDHGWGMIPEDRWPYDTSVWPPVEPPGLDAVAKDYRLNTFYRRVRTVDDCKAVLPNMPVMAALELTDEWYEAPRGRISSRRQSLLGTSHTVLLLGYDDVKNEFMFQNSWGATWGDHGHGYIAYDVFRATCIESWTHQFAGNNMWADPKSGVSVRSWGLSDSAGAIVHGCEIVGPGDERRAWSYAVERDGALEVEELFVMRQFRRKGYGAYLLLAMESVAAESRFSLRLWVSHADTTQENLRVVQELTRRVGFKVSPSRERWAGYLVGCWGSQSDKGPESDGHRLSVRTPRAGTPTRLGAQTQRTRTRGVF